VAEDQLLERHPRAEPQRPRAEAADGAAATRSPTAPRRSRAAPRAPDHRSAPGPRTPPPSSPRWPSARRRAGGTA
jgi:hypothetical protein